MPFMTRPSTLLIVGTLAPLVATSLGLQLFDQGGIGYAAGLVICVALSIATIARPGLQRRWRIVAPLPVVFWLGSLLWYLLVVD